MAVLVEAISVIVWRDAIDKQFQGGWREFENVVPNRSLCADDELARVGFMSPPEVETFVRSLEKSGLTFVRNGQAVDIVVVDQPCPPTSLSLLIYLLVKLETKWRHVGCSRSQESLQVSICQPNVCR